MKNVIKRDEITVGVYTFRGDGKEILVGIFDNMGVHHKMTFESMSALETFADYHGLTIRG